MSDRTPNWPGALKKTNFQIHSCHPQSGSNPGPWILTTGTVLYQLSWVEAVTHPITNTAQWCLTSVMYEIPVYQLYHSVTGKSSWRGPEHDALYVTILEVVFPTVTMSLTSTTVSFCNQWTMVGHFWKLDPHDPEFNKGSDCSKVCSLTRQIPQNIPEF